MFCKKCGANLEEGQNVCPNCGYNVQDEKPFVAPTTNNATNVELDKTPISVVEYIGYFWVMVIPCAGLILAIVWAFTHKNENVRNYFKAVLINIVILTIVIIIMYTVFFGSLFAILNTTGNFKY